MHAKAINPAITNSQVPGSGVFTTLIVNSSYVPGLNVSIPDARKVKADGAGTLSKFRGSLFYEMPHE